MKGRKFNNPTSEEREVSLQSACKIVVATDVAYAFPSVSKYFFTPKLQKHQNKACILYNKTYVNSHQGQKTYKQKFSTNRQWSSDHSFTES